MDGTSTETGPILVVEDDEDLRTLIRRLLESSGFAVLAASDGVTALEMIEGKVPSLVVSDLMLPHMDGEDFIVELRRRYRKDPPKVLLLSASDARKDVARRVQASASLAKPFDGEDFLGLVRQLLGRASTP